MPGKRKIDHKNEAHDSLVPLRRPDRQGHRTVDYDDQGWEQRALIHARLPHECVFGVVQHPGGAVPDEVNRTNARLDVARCLLKVLTMLPWAPGEAPSAVPVAIPGVQDEEVEM